MPSQNLITKRFVLPIISGILAFSLGWIANENIKGNSKNGGVESRCFYGQVEPVDFINANVLLEIQKTDEGYVFNGSLISNSNIDFGSGSSIYLQLSIDSGIPYKLDETLPFLEINLDGTIPPQTNFTFSSKELKFTDSQIKIVDKFLNKETSPINVSIKIYNHAKSLIQVINKVLTND